MKTHSPKAQEIKRDWYLFDAKDKILGRLATEAAECLMGKNKPYFSRHLDCGDYVVVVNSVEVSVTGRKEKQKKYYRHSGFPGGFKTETLAEMRQKHPERIITHAVSGMLPQNKLKDQMLKRLYVFPGEEHPYKNQKFIIHNS